jgi:hypothetical protein
MYPKAYDPSYALGACILAIVFVAAFALIFPLICPPVVLLIFLTLIAHRFLVGYVFGRTDSSQTGGLLQLWVLRRFATLLALQPLLLGLLLLSRELWILGGIMGGVALLIICGVEGYASWRLRKPSRRSLSAVARHSLHTYENSARPRRAVASASEEKSTTSNTSDRPRRRNAHTSISSVLDMMNITLAVMPSPARNRGPVPLRKVFNRWQNISDSDTILQRLSTWTILQQQRELHGHIPTLPRDSHLSHLWTPRKKWLISSTHLRSPPPHPPSGCLMTLPVLLAQKPTTSSTTTISRSPSTCVPWLTQSKLYERIARSNGLTRINYMELCKTYPLERRLGLVLLSQSYT